MPILYYPSQKQKVPSLSARTWRQPSSPSPTLPQPSRTGVLNWGRRGPIWGRSRLACEPRLYLTYEYLMMALLTAWISSTGLFGPTPHRHRKYLVPPVERSPADPVSRDRQAGWGLGKPGETTYKSRPKLRDILGSEQPHTRCGLRLEDWFTCVRQGSDMSGIAVSTYSREPARHRLDLRLRGRTVHHDRCRQRLHRDTAP